MAGNAIEVGRDLTVKERSPPTSLKTRSPAVTLVLRMPKLPCEVQDSGFIGGWALPAVFYDVCSDDRVSPSLFLVELSCSISLVRIARILLVNILELT
jgi:hypothetical protein